ncbi:MAG: 3-hydroxyacyl-CoA dehydrogenase family protein [Armatimonadota bacterium]|nr:3-hydroxyacyl-CoA dehydrogenase family protein [Armatimonadota bacterium]
MGIARICVVGAGTMGTGIAQAAAQAGIRVHLLDTAQEAMHRSQRLLSRSLQRGVESGKITPQDASKVRSLVSWEPTWQVLCDAEWVIEAVPDIMEVKREVLRRVAGEVAEHVPVATNTLVLPVDELGEVFGRPERFLGMHFFNPAPAMKLVVINPCSKTASEVVEAALELCRRMGKEPRTSEDVPRFVVNRAFGSLVAAAIDMWTQGADAEAIDSAIELGMGHSMGPLRTADMMGLDVVLAMLSSLHEETGRACYEPPEALVELVEQGRLGRKTGEGFYPYEEPA